MDKLAFTTYVESGNTCGKVAVFAAEPLLAAIVATFSRGDGEGQVCYNLLSATLAQLARAPLS